jgi:hypothetical protein
LTDGSLSDVFDEREKPFFDVSRHLPAGFQECITAGVCF